eukprot:4458090-Pyramimonas_sp.AAC.1
MTSRLVSHAWCSPEGAGVSALRRAPAQLTLPHTLGGSAGAGGNCDWESAPRGHVRRVEGLC